MNVCVSCGNEAHHKMLAWMTTEPEVFSWRDDAYDKWVQVWCVECWGFRNDPDWIKCACGRPMIPGYDTCHHCGAPWSEYVIDARRFETYAVHPATLTPGRPT